MKCTYCKKKAKYCCDYIGKGGVIHEFRGCETHLPTAMGDQWRMGFKERSEERSEMLRRIFERPLFNSNIYS